MIKITACFAIIAMLILGSGPLAPAAVASPEAPMHLAALPGLGTLFAGKRPTNIGVKDGQLSPCPGSPNCVVSQGSPDAEHAIDPIAFSGDPAAALTKLSQVVEAMPRTEVIDKTDTYLYAEFTSDLMGFVDDVEFLVDAETSVIHVRSASRLGQSDLGANRKRIEAIRSQI